MASINFENIKVFNGVDGGSGVLNNPTSLEFGPDGRLYVSEQNGSINAFTVAFAGGEVQITGHEQLTLANGLEVVKSIQNHNDDGSEASEGNRQVTGILTAGTAEAPILYVSSSDPRIASNGEKNLDTNSGVLTQVTFDPDTGTWTAVDLVRGLPRSEENHSVNGMVLSPDGTKLYLQVGGFTNNGAPSQFFSYTAEYALSGAILEIDLVALDAIATKTDPDGGQGNTARQYKYDLPTLDDPNIENVTDGVGEDADGLDEAGPWGGNDGLNQAILPADAPLRIFADGLRNGYDLAITDDGKIYTVDNGSNGNLGGNPNTDGNGEAINTPNDGGSGDPEPLFLIEDGGYYGHPNPTRANQDQAWTVYDDDGNPDSAVTVNQVADISALVPDLVDIQDGFLIDPSKFTGDPARLLESGIREDRSSSASNKIASVGSSTNGIVVYDSDGAAFNGALDGKLFVTQFNDNVTLLNVNSDGTALEPVLEAGPDGIFGTSDDVVQAGGADGILEIANNSLGVPLANPLDVAVGPNGTLWVAEIVGNEITVLAPTVTINPDDPDSDNDGIDNIFDPFVRDATNGTSVVVTPGEDLLFDFDPNQDGNLPGPGGFGGGLTGVMIDGVTDPEDFLQAPSSLPGQEINLDNVKFITAAGGGTTVIEAVSNGDPFEGNNSGEFLFHTGVTISPSVETFTVKWSFFNPGTEFTGNFQQIGGYIGTGDQSNYLKVVAIQNNNGEIQVSLENDDAIVSSELLQADDLFDVDPTDNAKVFIELTVNPDAETATPTFIYENAAGETTTVNGNPVSLTGTKVLDAIKGDFQVNGQQTGLAIGLFTTNTGQDAADTFQAVFDDIEITATEKQVAPEAGADALTTQIDTTLIIPVADLLANDSDLNGDTLVLTEVGNAQNGSVSLDDNATPGDPSDDLVIFTPADQFEGTASFDYTLSDGTLESTGNVTVDVSDQFVLFRVNTTQETIQALANDPFGSNLDWIGTGGTGAQSGNQSGLGFSVNTGNISTHNITGRDPSVPDYVPQELFAKERWDPISGSEMVYSFGDGALPIGTYTVNLFAGNGFGGTSAPGQRVFDIEIEGSEVFTDVDLSAQFGHQTGGLLSWTGQVTDGTLDIEWLHDVENPTVNGIEIIAGATGDVPLSVSIVGGDQTVGESDGKAFVSVLASQTVPNDDSISFTYVIEGNTATPTVDYTPDASLNGSGTATFTGNATIGGGSSDFQIPIDILPDDLVEGNETFTVTITSVSSNAVIGPNASATVTIADDDIPEVDPGSVVYRVNAGGATVADPDGGPDWSGDQGETANNDAVSGPSSPYLVDRGVANDNVTYGNNPPAGPGLNATGAPDDLFITERFSTLQNPNNVGYAFPVPDGDYVVNLYFDELFFTAAGSRVFDVALEGQLVLDDFDTFAAFGNDTGLQSFNVSVTDGVLNVEFLKAAVNNPHVAAIEIIAADDAATLPQVSIAAPSPDSTPETGGLGSTTTLLFPVSFDTPPPAPVTIVYSVDLAGEVTTGLETTLGADGFITVDVPSDDVANGPETVTVTLTGISTGDATVDVASASATVTEDDTSLGDSFNGTQADGNDWSNDGTAPDAVVLNAGSNTLILQAAQGDADYVTFEVPEGQQLVSTTLTAYVGGANAAFLGLQQGTSVPTQAEIQDGNATLDGGTVFDATQVASDLLPLLTSTSVENAGQPTGDLPDVLGPGQYTFWFNQNQTLSEATLELVTEPVGASDPFPGADIPVGDAVLAINSGTGGAIANDPIFGLAFKADEQFETPSNTYTDGGSNNDASGNNPAFDGSILETERFAGTLTYTLTQLGDGTPLVAGEAYVLDLIATELFQDTPGERIFDISVNGSELVTDLDLVAAFGIDDPATAELEGVYRLRTPVTVSEQGEIVIELAASEDNAKLSGLILFETEAASLPRVAIAADAPVVAEADGAQAAFTVSLSEPVPVGETVTVDYLVGAPDDTATAGIDYVAQSGQLTFGENTQTQTILVDLINDLELEPAESLTVTLTGADLGGTALAIDTETASVNLAAETEQTGDPGSETLTVQDDDEVIDVSSGGSDTIIGTSDQFEDLTLVGFDTDDVVSIAGASSAAITSVTEGSVLVGVDTDGDGLGDTILNFDSLPDPTPQTPLGPDDFEASFDAATGSANVVFAPLTQVVSLIGPADTDLDEASEDAIVLTVQLSQPAAADTTVAYTLSGSAEDGSDYRIAPTGSVEIPAGETEGFLVLETLNDSLPESDESLTVSLVSTTEGALSPGSSSVTFTLISEDTGDAPGDPVTLEAEDFTGLASSAFFEQAALDASGLALIRLDGGQSGTVETTLPEPVTPGLYDVAVTYFDENDGTSSASFAVDGETIGNWLFSNDGPGSAAQAANLRTLVFQGVALGADSVLSLSGTQDFGEFVRFDKVAFTRTGDLPPDDTTGPLPSLALTGPATPADPAILEVTLSDDSAIDAATIDATDASITGPGGPVSPLSPPAFDSETKTITFTFEAPDGGWAPGDYSATFAEGAVEDALGNPSQAAAPAAFTLDAPVETPDAALAGDLDGDTLANSADGDIDGDGTPNLDDRAAYNAGNVALDLIAEGSFAIDFTGLAPGLTPFEAGFDGVAQTADGSAELDYATNNGAAVVEEAGEGRLQFASTNADTNNGQQAFTRLIDTGGAGFTFTGTFDNPAFGSGTNLVNFSQYGLILSMTGAPGASQDVGGEFFKAVAGSPGNDFETSGKGAFTGADLKVALPTGVTQDDFASVALTIVGNVDGGTVTLTSSYTAFDEIGVEIASGLIGTKTVTPGSALHAALTGASAVPVAFGVTSTDFGNGGSFPVSIQNLSVTSDTSPLIDTEGPTSTLDVVPPAGADDPVVVTASFADDQSGLDPATLDGDELILTSNGPDTIPVPVFEETGNGTATYTFAAPPGGWQGTGFTVAVAAGSVTDLAGNANTAGAAVAFDLGDAPSDPALDILNGLTGIDTDGVYGPDATGSVVLSILAGGNNVEASNFGNSSFELTNTGQKQVAAVFIDVGNAIYGDSVFDNDGSGGDTISQLFSFNGGSDAAGQAGFSYHLPGDTPLFPNTPNNSVVASGGFDGLAILFSGNQGGFATGETVLFGGDMDPNSIAALNKSDVDSGALLDTQGNWDVGGISGAELIGSEFTILFDDGTSARGVLFSDGSKAGSIGEAVQGGPQSPVSVTVNGFQAGDADAVYGGTEPVITVTGTPGQDVRVVVTHGFNPVSNTADNIAGIVADRLADREPDFQVNNAANFQIVDLTLGTDGTATVPAGAVDYNTPPSGVLAEDGGLFYNTLPIAVAAVAVTDATNGAGKVAVGPASAPVYLTSTGPVTGGNSAPQITGDAALSVDAGAAVTLTPADLSASDDQDDAATLVFDVSGQSNGSVQVDGVAVSSFTQAQLAAGSVSFVHDGSATTSAAFTVSVTDSEGAESSAVEIDVDVAPSAASLVTLNLIDPVTDEVIRALSPTELIEYGDFAGEQWTVQAIFNGSGQQSVQFLIDGVVAQTESFAPYALFGDIFGPSPDYNGGALPANGETLSLTANVYSGTGATGTLLASRTVDLTFAETGGTNLPPVVDNPVADDTFIVDAPLAIDVSDVFSDADDDTLLLDASGLPEGVDLVDGLISGTPTETGVFTVTLTADDGEASAEETFVLTVVPEGNLPPEIGTEIPDETVTAGAAFTLALPDDAFTDDEDPDLELSLLDPPEGFTLNGTTLSGSADIAPGTYELTVVATDDDANTASQTFTVTVAPSTASLITLNLIDPATDQVVRALQATDLIGLAELSSGDWAVDALFSGSGVGSIQFLINGELVQNENFAPYALFGGNGQDFDGQAVPAGETVTLTTNVYSGSGGSGSLLASRTVSLSFVEGDDINLPPVVTNPVADDTVVVDATLSIDVSEVFNDANGDELLVEASGLPAGLELLDGVITGTPTETGTFTVTLTADDGEATAQDSFTLSVVPEPPSPVIINLIDPVTDTVVQTLSDGDLVGLDTLSADLYAIEVQFDGSGDQSVVLSLNGGAEVTESFEPYALFGDELGDFNGSATPAPGTTFELTAEVYSADGGQGNLLASRTISFTFEETATPAAATTLSLAPTGLIGLSDPEETDGTTTEGETETGLAPQPFSLQRLDDSFDFSGLGEEDSGPMATGNPVNVEEDAFVFAGTTAPAWDPLEDVLRETSPDKGTADANADALDPLEGSPLASEPDLLDPSLLDSDWYGLGG